jgi:predicted  nucleic acid-binding Zn-ribbon protein
MARENQTIAGRMKRPPTFDLRQFMWETPYRLLVSGTFDGLRELPADATALLIVKAGQTEHRLPAVPGSVDRPPGNGRIWHAQFAWQDPPVGFRAAQLQLGDLVVDLPEPGARRRRERPRRLPVRSADVPSGEPRRDTTQSVDNARTVEDVAGNDAGSPWGGDSVGSQVELLAAQEEVLELRTALRQVQAELSRARDDLQAERERRAGDTERFREGLANVRTLAERALSDEQAVVNRVIAEFREAEAALETKNQAIEALRTQLEAANADRAEAEAALETKDEAIRAVRTQVEEAEAALETRDEAIQVVRMQLEAANVDRTRAEAELETKDEAIQALRDQLEAAGAAVAEAETEADALRKEVAELRSRGEENEDLRAQLETARGAFADARGDAERLLGRLTAIRDGREA